MQIKSWNAEFLRFLLVGVGNTLLGYVLFLGLIKMFPYGYAYSISYGIGIIYAYLANSKFVFKQPLSLAKFLQFPLVYVVQYVLGLAILWLVLGQWHWSPQLAMLLVIVLTVPVTFILTQTILQRRS